VEDKNGSYALSKAKLPPVLPRWGFFIFMNEIWDYILKADTKRQIISDIRSKEKKIDELPKFCGSCDLWMTDKCQREKIKRVSAGMDICSDFKQQEWVTTLISKLQIEVSELRATLNIV